jgi:hypothetical protein
MSVWSQPTKCPHCMLVFSQWRSYKPHGRTDCSTSLHRDILAWNTGMYHLQQYHAVDITVHCLYGCFFRTGKYLWYLSLSLQCHMSLMDFVVSAPACGWSVTDFWGWDAHEAQLRCPDEVDGDIWIWSAGRGLNLSSTKLPRPWSPWGSSPSRKNPHGRTGNQTQDLMISSQKLWPLDHEAGHIYDISGEV